MRKITFVVGILATLAYLFGIYFVLSQEHALVTHPKGIVAQRQLDLIITNIILMLLILVPTLIFILAMAWKYRGDNAQAKHDPNYKLKVAGQAMLWIIPSIIVAVMAPITWKATHALDPYKPLESNVKPLQIQVVAINWKWLFIYPEQEIATLNFVQFPERTPIHFSLAADNSPMNSFWIPELSGQIYAMSGMITPLHVMADGPGEYPGKAVEINGDGYADMRFTAKSTTTSDFQKWVAEVKKSPLSLTEEVYNKLREPSIGDPVTLYSSVEKDLFNKIVMKYMPPT
jgi:cytochrome o ubiquinol oxidase subunit 2